MCFAKVPFSYFIEAQNILSRANRWTKSIAPTCRPGSSAESNNSARVSLIRMYSLQVDETREHANQGEAREPIWQRFRKSDWSPRCEKKSHEGNEGVCRPFALLESREATNWWLMDRLWKRTLSSLKGLTPFWWSYMGFQDIHNQRDNGVQS